MIWMFIGKLQRAVLWLRWLRIALFCESVAEGPLSNMCRANQVKTRIMGRDVTVWQDCCCDSCPKLRGGNK